MALQFVTGGILTRNDTNDVGGSPAGVELNLPYDIGFTGGFDDNMVPEVVTIRTYGEMIMGRAGTFIGCWGYMDSPPSGSTTIDILNQIGGNVPGPGISIYSLTAIARVNITAGGSSYSSVPTVAFSGGGGTGAAGTAVVASNAVTSITMTNTGTGYTSVPTVAFSGGGGTGATGTAVISVKPQFTQTNDLTSPDALLSVISSEFHAGGGQQPFTSFNAGDKITFKVITLGSTPGSGMRVTLKCKA